MAFNFLPDINGGYFRVESREDHGKQVPAKTDPLPEAHRLPHPAV